jgi:hypothetical protein
VNRARSILYHGIAAILGVVAAFVASAGQWLPTWLVAATFAISFILLLPRRPWLVAAFCGGAALMMVANLVIWSVGSRCASEVKGVIVEHDCGEPPPQQTDR